MRSLFIVVFLCMLFLSAFAATENLTVGSCDSVTGNPTISNCSGLNTSDDDTDVILSKSAMLGTIMSDTVFDGSVNSVTVTVRHSGEAGIGGTVGITLYDTVNSTSLCSEDSTVSNTTTFTTDTITACTPTGDWDYTKLDNLQVRIQNEDNAQPQDAYISFVSVEIDYTPSVCGDDTITGRETCDGAALNGETCLSQGFVGGGTFACETDCSAYDTVLCLGEQISTGSGTTCGIGCCGGGTCDSDVGEDFGTCRLDCKTPKTIHFDVQSPLPEEEFVAGDTVIVQVGLKADSITAIKANNVIVTGENNEEIELFDNGEGADSKAGDGVYSGLFTAPEIKTTAFLPLNVSATVETTTQSHAFGYQYIPTLAIGFGTNKETYTFGDIIKITGTVSKNKNPVALDLIATITTEDGEELHAETVSSNINGSFKEEFQITGIHPEGNWVITVSAVDAEGNDGFFAKEVTIKAPSDNAALSIKFANLIVGTAERGDSIQIVLSVEDEYAEFVEQAEVVLEAPDGSETTLRETDEQTYVGKYTLPVTLSSGIQQFTVRANKKTTFSVSSGSQILSIQIAAANLNVELLEPQASTFSIGDDIPIKLRITYGDGNPVNESVIQGSVNGTPVTFRAIDKGVYVGTYFAQEKDVGTITFSAAVEDSFMNRGTVDRELNIQAGFSPNYYVKTNPLAVGAGGLIIIVILAGIVFTLRAQGAASGMEKQLSRLQRQSEQLEIQYFKDQTLNKSDYTKMSNEVEAEIAALEKKMKK
jgi:hypothetical protein